jgi:hypothetical protein
VPHFAATAGSPSREGLDTSQLADLLTTLEDLRGKAGRLDELSSYGCRR